MITSELKPQLLQHIKENSFKKEIFIDRLNCTNDHKTFAGEYEEFLPENGLHDILAKANP